ncbi:MAG: ATP-dependent DNA helicase [Lachnospiraceae bacterium]|nr:ATP-dependent DNA helicase [Lachnospiraceae bacterium]MDY5701319.1 ATP-dependent DNA helicase [Lachnospiraceae bacterium]
MSSEQFGFQKEIRISVRKLVEFILRSGDLDNRRGMVPENAMAEGGRIHRMLQRRMGSEYRAEVPLRFEERTPDYVLTVEGRADGIITLPDQITIDEIKGTYRDLERIREPEPVHVAQARCYAHMYTLLLNKKAGEGTDNGKIAQRLDSIRIRITYCNMDTEEIRYFFEEYSMEELEEWFNDLVSQYKKWADYQVQWEKIRQMAIKNSGFPYSYRKGQKELAQSVYRTIYHGKKLFLEAPTGVGKTLSTVFPAVKAIGEGLSGRLFYLTAKTITRTAAAQAFQLLQKNGLRFKTVTLTAREKICFQEEVQCNPDSCPFAKGHYDRINEALFALIGEEETFSREVIEAYAKKYQVCPFELTLDCSLFADGVIGDYNYLFDPHVYLKRFFGEGGSQNSIFLIDEAHNLVERGREMYSAVLLKEDFLALKKKVRPYSTRMEKQLERCNRELLLLKRETQRVKEWETAEDFVRALSRLSTTMSEYLENHNDTPVKEEVLAFYFEVSHFLFIYEGMQDDYVIYTELTEMDNFLLKLFCVNPARQLKACMDKGRSSILFSATLLPVQYYKKLLGGEGEDYEVYAGSSFDPRRCGLFIGRDVTSKYARRSQEEFYRIASYIHHIVEQRQGNYMVFFSSFAMLEQIYAIFQKYFNEAGTVECIRQKESMKEEERENFLKHFTGNKYLNIQEKIMLPVEWEERTLLGFCIMGGIFGEGIDLKQDSLIGAILVGTGLPQVCMEREILKKYFQEREGTGFEYAYRYPGMNKVLQAAGRVIRTQSDLGIVALLDERFLQSSYTRMFPKEWREYEIADVDTIGHKIEKFWNEWL